MFSAAENEAYKNPNNRSARNQENEPNRRLVAFVFRPHARTLGPLKERRIAGGVFGRMHPSSAPFLVASRAPQSPCI